MLLKKDFMVIVCSFLLISCGTGSTATDSKGEIQTEELNTTLSADKNDSRELNTTTVKEEVLEANTTEVSNEENLTVEVNTSLPTQTVQPEENLSIEVNASLIINREENKSVIEDVNYTEEELTLSAYARYITNSSSDFSAKLVSLLFKGALPVQDGVAIIKENEEFSFKLTWQNAEYAKNVNYYFFNGRQRSIEYWTVPLPSDTNSYTSTCQALADYRFKCNGLTLDESINYEGRVSPVNSSFVMAICDRSTRDSNRICDFIRIPIQLQK